MALQPALSHVHNLYFVAHGQHIYVYVPQFPEQTIPKQPVLIFASQASDTDLPGYIDQRFPHAINSLVVQFLGKEEVIAVVRDDGDIDAFLVRHIVHGIERRREPGNIIGIDGDEISPFFQSNVGISAWGLAIHSEARIIAVSSNAHEVRVFKFGLLRVEDEDGPNEKGGISVHEDGNEDDRAKQRRTDVTQVVLNGETNIPYIAFCNTGDDPEARWLLTTDISGVCRAMDLHAVQPVQAFRFGRSFASPHTGGFDRLNAGWAIMFLDKRSFQSEHDASVALGVDEDLEHALPKIHGNGSIWDLSNTVRRLKESSEPFIYHQIQELSNDQPPARPDSRDGAEMFSSTPLRARTESRERADPSDGSAEFEVEVDMSDDIYEDDDDAGGIEVEVSESMMDEEAGEPHSADEVSDVEMSDSESEEDQYMDSNELIDDGEDPENEGTEDSISFTSFYNGDSIIGNLPRFVHPSIPLCGDLPCPILHASVRNVYLLQPSNKHNDTTSAFAPPMLGFANPLRQSIHQQFEYLRIFERLNMSAYIPPLGVVLLASQKGRVVVLSLSKLASNAHYPEGMRRHRRKSDTETVNGTIYAMRVECILPFENQEKANQRSCHPLHGIAVGPLQGSEALAPELRRWRLMMMYQDHSILSYQIGPRSKAMKPGVNVTNLMV